MDLRNLKFSELDAALGGGVLSYAAGNITLSLTALTGDTYAALTDEGVVEVIAKLLNAAKAAQDTANAALNPTTDTPLTSFFPPTNAGYDPDEGGIVFSQQVRYVAPVDLDAAIGTNA
jgi:hypothetical protein